jgi:hypothetical protein
VSYFKSIRKAFRNPCRRCLLQPSCSEDCYERDAFISNTIKLLDFANATLDAIPAFLEYIGIAAIAGGVFYYMLIYH